MLVFLPVVLSAVLHLAFMCTCCVLQRQPIRVHWTIFGCYFPGQLVLSCIGHIFVSYHGDQDYARWEYTTCVICHTTVLSWCGKFIGFLSASG